MKSVTAKRISMILVVVIALAVLAGSIARRGSIRITIQNDTAEEISVVSIQDQPFQKTVPGNRTERFSYRITQGGKPIMFQLQIGGEVIDKEIVEYAERAYHGSVAITVSRSDNGNISVETSSNVKL